MVDAAFADVGTALEGDRFQRVFDDLKGNDVFAAEGDFFGIYCN